MKSQLEKNKEILLEKIEKYCEYPMSDSVAEHLSVYRGAYKALRLLEKEHEGKYYSRGSYKPESEAKLDGNTEFERILSAIPTDKAHMVKITNIFKNHLESLKVMNPNAYNSVLEQLSALAKW